MTLKSIAGLATLAFTTLFTQLATAQPYPSRPVKIIVPVGNGGTSDVLARQLAAKLQVLWGQGVVVENRPGVAGNLGTEIVVKSPADGYTLVLQSNAMVTNQALGVKANFVIDKDLTPIVLLGQTPMAIVAHPRLGINSVRELVAYAKANPTTLSYASCGIGTPHHMFMEVLKQRSGINLTHVSYKGCGPALIDVLGDQIPLAVLSANQVVAHVKSGKLLPIGVSSATRYSSLPQVATLEEQGMKPMDFTNWFGLFGPAGLPKDVVAKIHKDVTATLKEDAVRTNLATAGVDLYEGDGAAMSRLIKTDQVRYEQVVKAAQIKPE